MPSALAASIVSVRYGKQPHTLDSVGVESSVVDCAITTSPLLAAKAVGRDRAEGDDRVLGFIVNSCRVDMI